jgi:hypothetical protein
MPNPCPHCRRPVRVGAKFCGFCGTSLVSNPPSAAPPSAPPPSPPPAAAPTLAPVLLPEDPSADLSSSVLQRRARRKRRRLIVSLAALLVICLGIAIPLAIFGRPALEKLLTPSTATSTATHTARPAPTNTATLRPSPTRPPSATPTSPPSATPSKLPSATPTRLLPPTHTSTPSPLLLNDDFSLPLDQLWESWGLLETTIITGTTPALLLTAADVDSGGISSRNDQIALSPGLVITFTADVDYVNEDAAVLRFAWSPGESTPQELADGLPLALLISARQLTVQVVKTDGTLVSCPWSLEATLHTFRLEFGRDRLPLLFVDDTPACENMLVPIPLVNLPGGRIHFSGSGLIEDVSVSLTP